MYVDLELDKPRRLRFDLRAIRDLEVAMGGKPIGEIVQELRQVGVTAIVSALWAGLKHEDTSLNQNLITKILEQHLETHSIRPVLKAIDDALNESGLLKRAGEEPEGNAQPEPTATIESR